jgi:hypothetical protein
MLVESLAGTGQTYIEAQVRLRGDQVHVQVPWPTHINRSYGWVFDLPTDGFAVITALKAKGTKTVPSLAGTDQRYVPVQFKPTSGGKLHVQVPSHIKLYCSGGARSYGAATDLSAPPEVIAQAAMMILEAD